MHEGKILSVFVDESGRFQYPDKDSRFYIVGMVFHDQSMEISRAVEEFKRSLLSLGLDSEAFVFHAGPLIRREKGYEFFSRHHRVRRSAASLHVVPVGRLDLHAESGFAQTQVRGTSNR